MADITQSEIGTTATKMKVRLRIEFATPNASLSQPGKRPGTGLMENQTGTRPVTHETEAGLCPTHRHRLTIRSDGTVFPPRGAVSRQVAIRHSATRSRNLPG